MEKTRAVAYIRVSTERDAQLHSYEFQEHYWQSAFEDDPNTDLIGIYADKGISGHSVQKRPKFLVMMQEAREVRQNLYEICIPLRTEYNTAAGSCQRTPRPRYRGGI